jgi:molybdopterin-guanine dinucleotide biosynthesis protein
MNFNAARQSGKTALLKRLAGETVARCRRE